MTYGFRTPERGGDLALVSVVYLCDTLFWVQQGVREWLRRA
jgi:hypothetical protein